MSDAVVGLAGDWHGNTGWARHAIATFAEHGISTVYQLGDFGLFWPRIWNQYINEVEGACRRFGVTIYVTPGNHENWEALNGVGIGDDGLQSVTEHVKVFPRGHRWDKEGRSFVSLGGAPSIDFPHRLIGRTWWKEEAITYADVDRVATGGRADIMLAHDAPDGGTREVQDIIDAPRSKSMWTYSGLKYAQEGRELMNIAFQAVKPAIFAHGHYHVSGEAQRGDTLFLSLNCDGFARNLMSLNLRTLETDWLDVLTAIPAK